MTERRRGGLGRGLGALIPTGRPEEDVAADAITGRSPSPDYSLALIGGRAATGTPMNTPGGRNDETRLALPDETDLSSLNGRDGVAVVHGAAAAATDVAGPNDDQAMGGAAATGPPVIPAETVTNATNLDGPGGEGAQDDQLTPVGARYAELNVSSIHPNPRQPRVVFDEDALAELVHSIREIGILQPVVVRELSSGEDARYELVMGERRWRAAKEAGLATVPAIIRDTPDTALLRDALLENLHRAQLNPLEEAAAYDQLLQDFGCTQDQLAERIGRSRPQISNTLRLLKLPPSVQRRLAAGVLSAGHARALLGLAEAAAQERLAQRVVAEGLSVRSVEEIVAVGPLSGPIRTGAARVRRPAPAELTELEQRLADRFDTRVRIERGRLKGKIVIEFATTADLERIMAIIGAESDEATPPAVSRIA